MIFGIPWPIVLVVTVVLLSLAVARLARKTSGKPEQPAAKWLVVALPPEVAMMEARLTLVRSGEKDVVLQSGQTGVICGVARPLYVRFTNARPSAPAAGQALVKFECRMQGTWRLVETEVIDIRYAAKLLDRYACDRRPPPVLPEMLIDRNDCVMLRPYLKDVVFRILVNRA